MHPKNILFGVHLVFKRTFYILPYFNYNVNDSEK